MRLYEAYGQEQGFNTESRLELDEGGQFRYDETWADYTNVSLGVTVKGRWRREGDAVILHPLSVQGAIGRWVVGQERRGVERGDTFDLDGFKLRAPPERAEDMPIRNTGTKPLTVVLEPWGTRHAVAPGEQVRVVARGPGGMGRLEVIRGPDEVVIYGWSGSQVAVVREPTPPRPPAPKPTKQTVNPPVASPEPTPVDESGYARFEPRAPSPELAALIRRWVDELPADGNRLQRLCKANDALPLHCTQLDLWALRPDGQVLCIDHESFAQRAEPENMRRTAYAVLAKGAATHPELWELLPPDRAGLRRCESCGGEGWAEARPPAQGTDYCHRCAGIGWHEPR
jgi:hypothetical protein